PQSASASAALLASAMTPSAFFLLNIFVLPVLLIPCVPTEQPLSRRVRCHRSRESAFAQSTPHRSVAQPFFDSFHSTTDRSLDDHEPTHPDTTLGNRGLTWHFHPLGPLLGTRLGRAHRRL